MMRYSIRVDQKATVQSEVDYVQAYLNLQAERFQTDFSYSIDVPKDILDIPVPSMILQPLVENFLSTVMTRAMNKLTSIFMVKYKVNI